jgi:formylglycine-generating enzyme required for sulfatase activity/tRNA A-37 threonylcarbamoyl transferase component Bud32
MPTDDHNRTVDFTPPAGDAKGHSNATHAPPIPPAGPSGGQNGDTIGLPANSGPLTMNYDGADALTAAPGTGAESLSRAGLTGSAEVTSTGMGVVPEIPGYVVESEIARGGMGVVFKARHLRLNRPAAIKMILGGKYHDPATRIRFLIEAEAVAQLDHPHIVGVHEFGTHENLPFFVLEYIGGGTLAGKLARDGRFAPRAAADMVVKLADGIAAAHAKGIVHRDVKPANILLTEAGEPKVADFGLAKVGQSDMTATGAVMGTPSYMSPEQAAGRVREVGTTTDVYALGAILFELLSGRPPFLGDTAMATIQQVLTRDPDRPRGIDPAIPRDLETICLKCLEKDSKKRYGTAAELVADLRAFLDGRPITARPVGNIERAWKWTKRHPGRAVGMVASVVLAVGLVVAWSQVQADRANERLEAETKRADDRIAAEEKRAADLKAADDAAKRAQRETRAASLVQSLASADTAVVPRLLTDLAEFHDLTGQQLRELAKLPTTTKPGLHARMALLSVEPRRASELAAYLPVCKPEELLPVRSLLLPYAAEVAPGLWAVLTDANAEPGKRVRAACVLAGLTPDDLRWKTLAPAVVEQVTKENPLEAVVWSEALEPVRGQLLPAMVRRYPESRSRIESGKLAVSELVAEASGFDLTANLLARYTADRPAELAELAMIVDARHHRLYASVIVTNRAAVVPVLRAELDKVAFPGGLVGSGLASVVGVPVSVSALDPDPVFDALAKRQANAAAVLLSLGESELVWPLLRFPAGDPSARSYLLERLAGIGVDPLALIRRFREEPEISGKRAILIALGDFPVSDGWAVEREGLAKELVTLYRNHPDPGLHGAIDWLLRQRWGMVKELARIDAEMVSVSRGRVAAQAVFGGVPGVGFVGVMGVACGPLLPAPGVGRDRDWHVNGEGQTYAVVRGPVEFTLGSPGTEPGRIPVNEPPHRKRIGRSFAIATKEVTVEQFLRFKPRHSWVERYSPDRDSPAVGMTWYEAAEYCNWLSEREGIPREQWCYEPNEKGLYAEGMQIKTDHLKLGGYRLPTEAEWEYACRSGSVVSRYFGRSEELLPRYGWYQKNGEDRAWPVGRLRPNELGLFDMLGNALEWVEDPAQLYVTGQRNYIENKSLLLINERMSRLFRGGAFPNAPVYLRCAGRDNDRPGNLGFAGGFRPVRTSSD